MKSDLIGWRHNNVTRIDPTEGLICMRNESVCCLFRFPDSLTAFYIYPNNLYWDNLRFIFLEKNNNEEEMSNLKWGWHDCITDPLYYMSMDLWFMNKTILNMTNAHINSIFPTAHFYITLGLWRGMSVCIPLCVCGCLFVCLSVCLSLPIYKSYIKLLSINTN